LAEGAWERLGGERLLETPYFNLRSDRLRLPDGSIAYAREQDQRPGSFVTVVHVVQTGAGWSVDRWEASGC